MQILHKTLLITAGLILVAGAGCAQSTITNLNVNNSNDAVVDVTPANTNVTAVENTNAVLENINTNVAEDGANDTGDWLTYTNDEYGFSFRYPADWKIEENHQKCWILTSPEIQIAKESFFAELEKTGGGTDAGPYSEMSFCVKDEQVKIDLIKWVEENTYKYVDEEYRGEATFNSLPAYLIVDLDFGKSDNYFLKVDGTVYSVYYEIVNDSRSEQIDLIAKSIKFN